MLTRVDAPTSRRAFLGLAAAGVAGAVSACSNIARSAAARPAAATARPWRNPVPENSLPGTSEWVIHHLGADARDRGVRGQGERADRASRFPLFVSTTARGVHRDRLPARLVPGARRAPGVEVADGPRRRRSGPPPSPTATNTVTTDWDPLLAGADRRLAARRLPGEADRRLRRAAVRAGHRQVAVLRGQGRAQEPACRPGRRTTCGAATTSTRAPSGAYGERSLVVSLDRPYDANGADMFLTYERNLVKLAEYLTMEKGGLDLAYVTSMDIDADPHLLDGASALISMGHDEYWTPQERANVTAARDKGVNLAFFGANAMFRRTRLQPTALGRRARGRLLQDRLPRRPGVRRRTRRRSPATGATPPNSDPESTLIGTIYEGYPVDAPFVVSSPSSWVYQGTGVSDGRQLPAPGRRRVRPGRPRLPAAAPDRGALPLPADLRRRRQLRRLRLLHARGRRRRLQQRHDALGRGDLRRPAARHRRRDPGVRPPGHDQRAARLRRRPRRGQVQGTATTWTPSTSTTAARSPQATCSKKGKSRIIPNEGG